MKSLSEKELLGINGGEDYWVERRQYGSMTVNQRCASFYGNFHVVYSSVRDSETGNRSWFVTGGKGDCDNLDNDIDLGTFAIIYTDPYSGGSGSIINGCGNNENRQLVP